jgi:4-aminobutyrate aminotransferase
MHELRKICDEYGILLVVDEVQSGFGRTGEWFAINHSGVVPDIVIMAKGLASGMPLSGIAASRELMNKWPPGSHGGTYGGNAVACAASVATIQAMREEGMIANAQKMGTVLMTGLRKLQEEHPEIGDVRGRGLMVATEFSKPNGEPWAEKVGAVTKACREGNLLLLTCGAYGNVVRWIPPLVVNQEQVQEALAVFAGALETAV